MLCDLGRDRDFLYSDKALLGHVSQPSVVKAGRPCVATQQVCRDRVAQLERTNAQDRYA